MMDMKRERERERETHVSLFPRTTLVFSSLPQIRVASKGSTIGRDQNYVCSCFYSHGRVGDPSRQELVAITKGQAHAWVAALHLKN